MFAQLFKSARRALSRTPSSDNLDTLDTHDTLNTMVTTRRGTETPGMAATPRSTSTSASTSKKRIGKRELDALDTPTQTKRQRKAEEADADATPRPTSPLAIRRRASPSAVAQTPASDDAVFETPDQGPASVYETPATRRKVSQGSPTPRAKGRTPAALRQSTLADEIPSSTQEESEGADDDDDADDATPAASPAAASAPATAHVRFGSEEPVTNTQNPERHTAPAPEPAAEEEQVDDDDASDSDEAPEVVTVASATSRAQAADADAKRARSAQQEKERLKREARAARIAEEQAAKQARAEKKAAKLARQAARTQQAEDAAEPAPVSFSALPTTLPALLPTALLDSIDAVRPPTPPPVRAGKTDEERRREKLNHHIKFLERTDKPAKDVKKGKLSVAVLAKQNRVLPPKASRDSRNVREHWLKGRRAEKSGKVKGSKGRLTKGKVERRVGGGGFLRGED